MIDVLLVISQGEYRADGGVASTSNVLSCLNGLSCHVVTNRASRATERWRDAGISVTVAPFDGYLHAETSLKQIQALIRSNVQAFRHVSAMQPDVVHLNDRTAFRGWGIGARCAGVPLVDNVRDTQPELNGMRRLKWLVELTLSARVLTLSDDMNVRWARSLRLSALPKPFGAHLQDKFTSIYSIVDTERFKPVPDEERVRLRHDLNVDGTPLLTYIASFHPKKAQLPFIERTLPPLLEDNSDVTVAFVGDFEPDENDQARACQEAVDRLGLHDHVRFVGYQSNVEQWYQAADLNVLASEKEGLARSMIESLACGTPVISSDVASAKEILEGYGCGRVVPQGAYEQLEEAIVELWQNDSLRKEMGERGAEVARELFDPETIAHQYQALYEEVERGI